MGELRLDQKAFRQLTEVIPNLNEWTEAASRFDGSAPEALKFTSSGFMDLNVDLLHRNGEKCEIALSHYYRHESGDMIPDPDMQVKIDFEEGSAMATTYQDAFGYQEVEPTLAQFKSPGRTRAVQLTAFLSQWLQNIQVQGHQSLDLET